MFKLVVLLSVAALAAAKPSVLAPVAYGAVVPGVSSYSQYSSSVLHGSPVVPAVYNTPVVASALYPGVALAQPAHSPAVVLDAVHGVPLDTPEVVAARAAHYTAKALSGYHHLRKRSLAYSSPLVSSYSTPVVTAYNSPVVSAYSTPVVSGYSTPLVSAYSTPLVAPYSVLPKALSYHPY